MLFLALSPRGARRRTCALALVAVAVALTACAPSGVMTSPLSVREAPSYGESVPEPLREPECVVLFATDRAMNSPGRPEKGYGAGRAMETTLGRATLRLGPKNADWDALVDRTTGARPIKGTIVNLSEFGLLPATVPRRVSEEREVVDGVAGFTAEVDRLLDESGVRTVTVFVHGFNTGFDWAVQKSAALWHMGGRRGLVVPYSWPAHDTFFNYATDRESAGISARGLREFLFMLANETDAERINVFTYSAGVPMVCEALHQIRLVHADENPLEIQPRTKLGEVVLAGADLDPDYFTIFALDRMQDVADRFTIYTSRIDSGLVLARLFYFSSPRLGRIERELNDEQRWNLRDETQINVVDVTRAQRRAGRGDLYAHGYWYGNPWVSNDLLALLNTGDDPDERGLARDDEADGVWRFPEDYPERVRGESR